MKQLRKDSLRTLLALAFVCACAAGAARADVRDLRVISARAGGVNLVSGDVKVRRAASADWVALSAADELKGGDTARTGATGRVEMLLNPGSYFRAGGGTEFTLASDDLDDLRVELARGSAVVEAAGYGDMKLSIDVVVPGALVKIVRSGVYRINVPATGPSEVAVTKGRAVVGRTVVKGGNVARVSGGDVVEVAKLDKKLRDEFDQWSRERGKELARANEQLNRRTVNSAFLLGNFNNAFDSSRSFGGFWFFNARSNCFTFLPYGVGWRSPYGYGYGTGVYWPRDPSTGWVPPYTAGGGATTGSNPGGGGGTWGGGGSGGSGGGSGNGGGGGSVSPQTPTPVTPPSRVDPVERPLRERTIEHGSRPDNQ
jgi:uncharacterized membrane protein YgcG